MTQKCWIVIHTSNRKTTGNPQVIKPSTNLNTISSFSWQPWKREIEKLKGPLAFCHIMDSHVYLCVKLLWQVQSAIAGQESVVAAAVRNQESPCMVKPGGVQPILVVMNATALQLIRIKVHTCAEFGHFILQSKHWGFTFKNEGFEKLCGLFLFCLFVFWKWGWTKNGQFLPVVIS